jgi:hypothetical protein
MNIHTVFLRLPFEILPMSDPGDDPGEGDDDALLEQLLGEIGTESVSEEFLDQLDGWNANRRDKEFYDEIADTAGLAEVYFLFCPAICRALSRCLPTPS